MLALAHRYALLHLFHKGVTALAATVEMNSVYGSSTVSEKTVQKWFRRFRDGDYSCEDTPRSGRPTEFDAQALKSLVESDPKVTVRELAERMKAPKSSIHFHLVKMGKTCKYGIWLPHELTPVAIAKRLSISTELHTRFHDHPHLLDRILTCDESWILYENTVRRRQWVDSGATPSPTAKPNLHVKKVMLSVFWDTEGIVYWELLPSRTTIAASSYTQTLDRVAQAMREKREYRQARDVIFQQDNAKPHTANLTKAKISELQWEVLPHPPYSPDLAPSDYHLFRDMKLHLRGLAFKTEEEIAFWIEQYFQSKDSGFFVNGIRKLVSKWEDVIEAEGHYVVE